MAPVPAAAFRELLADLPRTAFADFVADLWAARGRDVERDGSRIIVAGEQVLIPILDPSEAAAPQPEDSARDLDHVVVSATPTDDDAVVGPTELHGLLLYGIPRDRAGELFEQHFDAPLERDSYERTTAAATPGQAPSRGAPNGNRDDRSQDQHDAGGTAESGRVPVSRGLARRIRRVATGARGLAALGLLVVLVVGLAVGAPALAPGGGWLANESPNTTGPPAADTVSASTVTPDVDAGADHPDLLEVDGSTPSSAGSYPPGVSSDGVYDSGVLAEAHLAGVGGRPYGLTVTYREYRDGTPTGTVREWIRVEDPTSYVSRVEQTGVVLAEPQAVAERATYANGALRYERHVNDASYVYTVRDARNDAEWSPFADRVGGFLQHHLSARQTRVVGSTSLERLTMYLVIFRGESWVGSARIDEAGVVHALRWRFTPEDHPRVTAEVVVRYDFGPVTVASPDWIDEARNATEG